ncbi:MAG: hypothetical protein DHS20C14_08840 [Phycisphaeraceae bacterium]|nr:MAG: hypothetical protein DHS20C14_08840 [Phycisphaeraceae bacterium]
MLTPIAADAFGEHEARHLLWRAGFGGSPGQIAALAQLGPEGAVAHLLDYEAIDHPWPGAADFDKDIMRPLSAEDLRELRVARQNRNEDVVAKYRSQQMQRQRADRAQIRAMGEWWLGRMIETPRPLEEKMTLFWHGHFATGYRTIENSYHMFLQNQLFRRHAVGNFGELLFAIVRDPAMLRYLNNNASRADDPNENLARELMELFSLGEGNYSEADIKEGARALTGYSFDDDAFVFRPGDHDQGIKRILGESGRLDGDGFVRAILGRRACSAFIAGKMYRFFCREVPTDPREMDADARAAVDDLANTMLRERYEIRPVLRRLLLSEHFYSDAVVGEQIKSPATLVVGAVRSLGTPTRDVATLVAALDAMGQALFQPPSVKGWAGGRSWISTSTLYTRQNTLAYLLTGRKPTGFDLRGAEAYDPKPLARALVGDPKTASARAFGEAVADFVLGPARTDRAVEELSAVGERAGRVTPTVAADMVLLASAMPEYQLC